MKHFKNLLFLSILCSLVLFTNCGDSDDPVADTPANTSDDSTDDDSTTVLDADGDGIADTGDTCADTPSGETVDSKGCSNSQRDTDGDGVSDDLDTCMESIEGAPVDENGCSNAKYSTFNYSSLDREYIYYEPAGLTINAPLIFVMHGYSDDASIIELYSGFNAIADSAGFAVCYPRGTIDYLGNRFFNAGYDFHLGIETVDDLGFLETLAEYLQTTHGLDPNRTYATGLSNGGDMCYKIACQGSDIFRAVASVAGFILQDIKDNCINNIPIPIMEIHGTSDDVSPYDGDINNTDGWGAYPSTDSMIEFFANRNEYTTLQTVDFPDINSTDGSTVTSLKYTNLSNCKDVWLYRIVGGGHDWPGSFGNMDINSSIEIWNFFQSTYCN